MSIFFIKEIEKVCGIKAHTIRVLGKRYGLIVPRRTNTNIRYHTDDELRKLLNVYILIRNGFKISQIAQMSENNIIDKVIIISFNIN